MISFEKQCQIIKQAERFGTEDYPPKKNPKCLACKNYLTLMGFVKLPLFSRLIGPLNFWAYLSFAPTVFVRRDKIFRPHPRSKSNGNQTEIKLFSKDTTRFYSSSMKNDHAAVLISRRNVSRPLGVIINCVPDQLFLSLLHSFSTNNPDSTWAAAGCSLLL